MSRLHPITFEEIERLAVDEKGNLHWDEKPVITEQKVSLAWWVNAAAVVGGICVLITTALDVARFICGD